MIHILSTVYSIHVIERSHILRVMVLFCVTLTSLGALISIKVGPIPYTLQNFGVILSGLILPPKYALASQLLYLALIGVGLPVAAGLRGGLHVLLGYTAGFLWSFPITSYIMSKLCRFYLNSRGLRLDLIKGFDVIVILILSLIAITPLYALGTLVYTLYVVNSTNTWLLVNSYVKHLIILTVMFLPQDLFMDHLIAIIISRELAKVLRYRGIVL
ncbi:MAG: hypothetical protein DRO18_03130 [Thermoprotei archaeon]|nr:MAG: hypothetical protein DRO18_03130 [Thermoprotei archaeon]